MAIKIDKNTGGPSVYYNSKILSINVGFITPITNNFCETCNRIRLSSTGKLFMCLGQNEFVDFRENAFQKVSESWHKQML